MNNYCFLIVSYISSDILYPDLMKAKKANKNSSKIDDDIIEGITFDDTGKTIENEDGLRNEISSIWTSLMSDDTVIDDDEIVTIKQKSKSSSDIDSQVLPFGTIGIYSASNNTQTVSEQQLKQLKRKRSKALQPIPFSDESQGSKTNKSLESVPIVDRVLTKKKRNLGDSQVVHMESNPNKKKTEGKNESKSVEPSRKEEEPRTTAETPTVKPLKLVKKKRSKEAYARRRQLSKEKKKAKKESETPSSEALAE